MAETATGLMTAGEFSNASGGGSAGFGQTVQFVTDGVATIFGQVAANKYVRDLSINHDDVIAEDIHRDNQTWIYFGITLVLLIGVAIILTRK